MTDTHISTAPATVAGAAALDLTDGAVSSDVGFAPAARAPLSAVPTEPTITPATPFGVHVVHGLDPRAAIAKRVEREVFEECFGDTPDTLAAEYGSFDAASIFLYVVDHRDGTTAGMMRIITPSPTGLKTLNDLAPVWGTSLAEAVPDPALVNAGHTWDVATLAVAASHRGRRSAGVVAMALYQAISLLGWHNGVQWLTATLDLVVLDLVQRACGHPFAPFRGAEPGPYLGSPASLPVYCDAVRHEARTALMHPDTHAFLFEGRGLEDLVSHPASWDVPRG
jgi:hypothetical protein